MKIKHGISALLSAVTLLSVSVGMGENSNLPSFFEPTAITAQASDYVWSGAYGGKFSILLEEDVYLYLSYADGSGATVVGSGIGKADASITIPDTVTFQGKEYQVTAIADGAFRNQTNLKYLYGLKYVEKIGNNAFSGCTNLDYVSIYATDKSGKNKIKTIGDEAFMGCAALTSYITPSAENNTIGKRAFSGCNKMSYIFLENTSYIGEGAFEYCNSVNEINLKYTNITDIYPNTFYDCCLAKEIILPDTLVTIGDNAFYRCDKFKEIFIPDSVTSIGENAFRSCRSLEMVMMSENIKTIADHAFYGCDMMNYFVCKNPDTTFGKEAVGYDHNRFYTGKKKNFTIWGKGGTIKEYADSLGFTYHDCSKAPSLATKKVKDYVWRAINTETNWSESDGTYYYNDFHKPFVNTWKYDDEWEGSCSGLAAASMLVYNDIIEFDDFCVNYPTINSIPSGSVPDFTKSFVNTLWVNQTSTYNSLFAGNEPFNKRVLRKMEYLTYAQKSAIFNAHKEPQSPGHAVMCFGLEFKEDAADKDTNPQWNKMNARIMLTDNNRNYVDAADYLYINTETGEWGLGKLLGAASKLTQSFQWNKNSTPNVSFDLGVDFIDVTGMTMENPTIITKQPEDAQAANGKKVKTSVIATGDGLTYQWYYRNPGKTEFLPSSVKKAEYSTTITASNAGRQVYCVIKDKYGNELKTNTVTLGMALSVSAQPQNVSAEIGKTVSTSVKATGDGLTYTWYVKNPGGVKFTKSSITKNTYSFKMTEEKDGRQVYCVIKDKYGNEFGTDVVKLGTPVKITKNLTDISVKTGTKVETTVGVTGHGLTYKWYYKNKSMTKFVESSTVKSDTYTLDKMTSSRDGRQIYCVITDMFGNTVKTNTVTLSAK